MKITFFVLLNIFVVIKSKSLLEKKTDENTLRSGVISYAVTIIFYEGGIERVFTGVVITKLSVLTVGHEACLINLKSSGSSDLPDVYDAWIVFRMGSENFNPSIGTSNRHDVVVKRSQVVDVQVFDGNSKKYSSLNIAVLTFYDPDQFLWALSVDYVKENCDIEGEAYYDVQKLISPLQETTVSIRIRKYLAIFGKDDCYILYGINLQDTQFCGKTENEMTFYETDAGAGLIQEEKVIGVVSHSKAGQWSGKLVEIVVFEKVGLHSASIFKATGCGLSKAMSLTKHKLDQMIRMYSNIEPQLRS